ncbi:unnamed protein product [Didymodactylos carnosus]|uniref:Uncharacterized protein n=1 Tax=Didymodactylos carnosus TaxID=1234261 RepID=A0A814Z392_9BILA|nr:unnamed protein product [Didymodactylos carnosus]CAF3999822.1 unnamed protein product [Didymodactylos carnosus]
MVDHDLQSRRMQRSSDDIMVNNDEAQSSLAFLPHVTNNVPYGVCLLESTLFLVLIDEQNSDTDSEYELSKAENDSSMRDEINSGTGENLEIDDENIIDNNIAITVPFPTNVSGDNDNRPSIPQQRLHTYTNILTLDYCEDLLGVLRNAHVSKSQSDHIIKLIKSALPIPNNLPNTLKGILSETNINDIFTKRSVCTVCQTDLLYTETTCPKCILSDVRSIAHVYDTQLNVTFLAMLTRLASDITTYKQHIINNQNNDDKK